MKIREIFSDEVEEGEDCGGEARLDEALRGGAPGHGGGRGDDEWVEEEDDEEFGAAWGRDDCGGEARLDEALRGGALGHGGSGEEGAEGQWEDEDWEDARRDQELRRGPSGRGGEASGSGRGGGGWLGKLVGLGARLALYPSLAYNVARNKMEAEFHWWDQIDEHIWLGAVPFHRHVPRLRALGVRGVVTLNEPFETFVKSNAYQDHEIESLQIPTRDYACAPSMENICKALEFINRHALQGNSTYVHCKAGRGRSTTVVLCFLIKYNGMNRNQAWAHTKSIRPRVCLTSAQQKAVTLFSTLNAVGGDVPSQSSVGVVARQRPTTRQIQPDPEDHLEL